MDSWLPYDKIKCQMITTKVDYQNSSGGIDACALLSKGLSLSSIKSFSIISILKLLLSVVKIGKGLRVQSNLSTADMLYNRLLVIADTF